MIKKEEIRNELIQAMNQISIEQNKIETKQKYVPKYSNEYYSKKTWSLKSYEHIQNIEVQLIQVENEDQVDMFNYIRHNVSCMPQCQTPGRVLSVLVYDKTTQTYLGILQFTTDLLSSEFKDDFIGLDPNKKGRLKKHIRDHTVNLSICVPTQPFGFHFCGGKLLASLAFSKEIHAMYRKKYSFDIALVVTTSIHGKSIQYDRLRQLKYIGLTKGFGVSHISTTTNDKIKLYINENYPKFNVLKKSKWQCIKFLAEKLRIDTGKLFFHGQQRGIYVGLTDTNSKDYLLKKQNFLRFDKLEYVDQVFSFWKERWAKQRSSHLENLSINSDQIK